MGDRSGSSQPGDDNKAVQIRNHIPNHGASSSNTMKIIINDSASQQITFRYERNPQSELFDRFDDFERKIMAFLDEYMQKQEEKLNKISVNGTAIKDQLDISRQISDDLVADNNKFKKYFECIKSFKNYTDQKLKILQIDVDELRSTLIASIKESTKMETPIRFDDVVVEVYERFERKKNVMLDGIAESPFTSLEERKAFDRSEVMKIIKQIVPESREPVHVLRLNGIGISKRRLVKVCFETSKDSIALLRNKERIMATFSVRIFPDETPHQRNYIRNLRSELKSRKKEGEGDLTIKYMYGIPQIIPARPFGKF